MAEKEAKDKQKQDGKKRILLVDDDREIVDSLKIELLAGERTAVTKKHTEDVDAYHLYLKGRYHWNRGNTEAFRKAIDQFQAAIRADPSYARAYAGLADAYAGLGDAGHSAISPKEAFSSAKAAVQKALELGDDPTSRVLLEQAGAASRTETGEHAP